MLTRSSTGGIAPPAYTDVTIVVDRSGSMCDVGAAVREGTAELLQKHTTAALRQVPSSGDAIPYFIRIVSFDNTATVLYSGDATELCLADGTLDIDQLARIYEGLVPRGTTRLIDTAMEEIREQQARVVGIKAGWSPSTRALNPRLAIVFALLTDGDDNHSTRCPDDLKRCVHAHRADLDVACQFVAANQDATAQGARFGFPPETCLQMDADPQHARAAMRCVADSAMRTMSGIAPGFSMAERTASSQVEIDESFGSHSAGITPCCSAADYYGAPQRC